MFLQKYFSVPEEKKNPTLEFGYKGINQYRIPSKDGKSFFRPIIPDMRVHQNADGTTVLETTVPEESGIVYSSVKIKLSELLALEKKMQQRFGAVLRNILNGKRQQQQEEYESKVLARIRKKSKFQKWGLKIGEKLGKNLGVWQGKKIISTKFVDSVIKEMEIRKLLDVDC